MQADQNILDLLREKGAEMVKQTQRALILQPGAIGDCVLMLPLAKLLKDAIGLGGVDMLGHSDYIGIFPGRTQVDAVRSIDSMDLHRLFVRPDAFDLVDGDPLIAAFADYEWILTFLGEPDGDFEQNLIFTANCSHSAEVMTLSTKPSEGFSRHVSEYYWQQVAEQCGVSTEQHRPALNEVLITVGKADRDVGAEVLCEAGADPEKSLVVIQPGSGGRRKCWHPENFLAVAKRLGEYDMNVLFLLGPAETEQFGDAAQQEMADVGTVVRDLALTGVLGVLSRTDVFIGNDSGLTHLAGAMGVKTYTVFGPTDPAVYRPLGPAVTVLHDLSAQFADGPSPDMQETLLAALREDAGL